MTCCKTHKKQKDCAKHHLSSFATGGGLLSSPMDSFSENILGIIGSFTRNLLSTVPVVDDDIMLPADTGTTFKILSVY